MSSNIAISLFSNQAALAFVATGSDPNGATSKQVRHFLQTTFGGNLDNFFSGVAFDIFADGQTEGGPIFRFSCGVWVDESLSLNGDFNEIATSIYNAEAKAVSFKTTADDVKRKVNLRVQNATTGIIRELLPTASVSNNARLILENSLYFMGVWEEKFDASQTEEFEFWLSDERSVRVPFLTCKRNTFLYKYDGFEALKLLYKKDEDKRQFTMSIFLPDDPDRLWEIFTRVGSYFSQDCPYKKVNVGEFKLPKFKISFALEASQVFKNTGLTLPFTADGDLTGIVKSPEGDSLHVSSIYQKSVVEVCEEGTEAAAATAAVVEVEEETESETVTYAALAVEVVEGIKVANDEEETETRTVVSMEDDEEGTEAAAPTSVVSMDDDEEGTESETVTYATSLEDDKEGTEAEASTSDLSVEEGEEGTSSDSMEDDEEGTSDAVILKVDRPFAFVITEEGLGGYLFAGYLLNPLTAAVCNI